MREGAPSDRHPIFQENVRLETKEQSVQVSRARAYIGVGYAVHHEYGVDCRFPRGPLLQEDLCHARLVVVRKPFGEQCAMPGMIRYA